MLLPFGRMWSFSRHSTGSILMKHKKRMSGTWSVVFCLAFLSTLLVHSAASSTQNISGDIAEHYLSLTMAAVDKALVYIHDHVSGVNLDGIIGLRCVEGMIGDLLARYWTRLPYDTVKYLRKIEKRAGDVADLATNESQKATPKYFARVYPLIKANFWNVYLPFRPLDPKLVDSDRSQTETYTEKASDDCLVELFGTEGQKTCSISQRCWDRMTQSKATMYSLTHQIFYVLNGIQSNCLTELETKAEQSPPHVPLTQFMDKICSNVFAEAKYIETRGYPLEDRDLFMEQIGLCGQAGYLQIAQWHWLPLVLQWQTPSGCWSRFPGEAIEMHNFDPKRYGNSRRKRSVPAKRVEKMMSSSDTCMSHRTSVALSALTSYLRRLVEVYVQG